MGQIDNECPVYKGLQRPLEFMGLQGRYISWGAATAGGGVLGFIIGYCSFGIIAALIALAAIISIGAALILIRQSKGLHTKKNDKGVFVFAKIKSQ